MPYFSSSTFVSLADIPLPILVANPACHLLDVDRSTQVYVICRLGNDSQVAADALRKANSNLSIKDVIGGLKSWAKDIDNKFPVY